MTYRKTYSIKTALSDLGCDFERYLGYCNYTKDNVTFWNKVIVFFRSRGFWAICLHRYGYWTNVNFKNQNYSPIKIILKIIYFLCKYLVVCLVRIEIFIESDIGPGLFLSNTGNMIFGGDTIGENCTIHHNVTIGQGRDQKIPTIGNNVWIGADTLIYGGLTIGNNTIIRENTLLSKSIPERMIVGGNPCRVDAKQINEDLRRVNLDYSEY